MTDHVKKLILVIDKDTLSRNEIAKQLGLKHRGNLRDKYISPAVSLGYVAKLYPESSKSPDQAYYLTTKGLDLLSQIKRK